MYSTTHGVIAITAPASRKPRFTWPTLLYSMSSSASGSVYRLLLARNVSAPTAQPLDWRTTSRLGTIRVACAGSSAIAASSRSAATRPISPRRMPTLVSRGLDADGHGLPVVEAGQRHVAGYGPPGLAERVGHAAGDLVAAAGDRVGVRPVGE